MTPNEARKDAKARLEKAGVGFDKLSVRTTSFTAFGYGTALILTIKEPTKTFDKRVVFDGVPKPSEGGYVPMVEGKLFPFG